MTCLLATSKKSTFSNEKKNTVLFCCRHIGRWILSSYYPIHHYQMQPIVTVVKMSKSVPVCQCQAMRRPPQSNMTAPALRSESGGRSSCVDHHWCYVHLVQFVPNWRSQLQLTGPIYDVAGEGLFNFVIDETDSTHHLDNFWVQVVQDCKAVGLEESWQEWWVNTHLE